MVLSTIARVSGIVQRNLNNLMPGGNVLGNVNNFAKKLLSKSPLEIREDDDAGNITVNPFNYGVVHYPDEVAQLGMGHYMIFDIIENQKTSTFLKKEPVTGNIFLKKVSDPLSDILSGAKERIEQNPVSSGRNTANNNPTHSVKRIASSIVLYIPPNLKTNFVTEYEQANTGFAGTAVATNSDILDLLKAAGREVLTSGASFIPGAGDVSALRTKVSGAAVNPNIESVFRSVPMREFNFVYDFAPKNKKELDMVHKIITLFKFHMLPDVSEGKAFLITPSEFNITYMYLGKKNNYIPKIARCVLKSMEIDQTPEGVVSTFIPDDKGAFPTYTKVSLNFLETEIMTKAKIAMGF